MNGSCLCSAFSPKSIVCTKPAMVCMLMNSTKEKLEHSKIGSLTSDCTIFASKYLEETEEKLLKTEAINIILNGILNYHRDEVVLIFFRF